MSTKVRKIGKYNVLGHLGKGGFSTVKLGEDETTGERWALKLLRKDKIADIKQVDREIAAMTKVRHPNVLLMKEVDRAASYTHSDGKQEDVILTVLELAPSGELFDFLNLTGKFSEPLARTYFQQLISGLHACHTQGIAHRDLKPENLLLGQNYILKLADFGLAGIFGDARALMYTDCGTLAYQAPEMLRSGYDATLVDIWASGVVLFLMIAGFPPYMAQGDWWHNKLTTNRHPLFWAAHIRNASFSDSIKDLISRMLTADPTKRITILDIAKHPWCSGPTLSESELLSEMNTRKTGIDAAKAAKRLEEAAKKRVVEAKDASSSLTGGDGLIYRSDGGADEPSPESEVLPLEAPSIAGARPAGPRAAAGKGGDELYDASTAGTSGTATASAPPAFTRYPSTLGGWGGAPGTTFERMTSTLAGFDIDGDAAATATATATATTPAPTATASAGTPPVAVEEKAVAAATAPDYSEALSGGVYTKFSSTLSPSAIFARISSELTAAGARFSARAAQFKLKVKVLTSAGSVDFAVAVFRVVGAAGASTAQSVVEFRRRSGDSMLFYHVYNEILVNVSDAVVGITTATAAPSSSSSTSSSATPTPAPTPVATAAPVAPAPVPVEATTAPAPAPAPVTPVVAVTAAASPAGSSSRFSRF